MRTGSIENVQSHKYQDIYQEKNLELSLKHGHQRV